MSGRPFADVDWVAALRRDLVPWMRTYPSLHVWHAGGDGGDVYATAIVLREEGLLPRARIYATAADDETLERIRRGDVAGSLDEAVADYQRAGGQSSLEEYYQAEGAGWRVRPLLRERVVFAVHSFASDASFNEFHLIVARGLAGRGAELHARAGQVLRASLCPLGFLVLGDDAPPPDAGEWLERLRADIGLYRRIA